MCKVKYTTAPAALVSAARSETEVRTSKQQCPNHVTAFYGSGPTIFYACPSCLICLSVGRPPYTGSAQSLFEYYYIYTTTRTDGIEEGNSNSLGFGLLWLEARSCYKREQP